MVFILFFLKKSVKARKYLIRFYVLVIERNSMKKFNMLVLTLLILISIC